MDYARKTKIKAKPAYFRRIARGKLIRAVALLLVFSAILLSATPVLSPTCDEESRWMSSMILSAQSRDIAAEIAAWNQQAEQIRRDNIAREQEINRLRNAQGQLREFEAAVNEQIRQINAQIAAYNNLIDAQERAIENTMAQILLREEEIDNTALRIEQRERQIEILAEQNEASIRQFGQFAAQTYMSSGSGSLGLLSGSASFADIMLHTEMLRNLGERNTELLLELLEAIGRQQDAIAELGQDILDLEDSKTELDAQKLILENELASLEETKQAVVEEVNRQRDTLRSLTAERAALQREVDSIRVQFDADAAEIDRINREISRIIREDEERRAREGNQLPNHSTGGFMWPTPGFRTVSSGFGWRASTNSMHRGIDIAGSGINNTPIVASQAGEVTYANWMGTFGIVVFINHGGGYTTVYAHMIRMPEVRVGDRVAQGQTIGHVGSTGRSTGPHLHFEIRKNGTSVNPMTYF